MLTEKEKTDISQAATDLKKRIQPNWWLSLPGAAEPAAAGKLLFSGKKK